MALLTGYLLGCIQTAYFVGKLHGIDIREHGSKNAGATNISRTMGKKTGVIVFIIDLCKCFAAFIIATFLFNGEGTFFTFCKHAEDTLCHCDLFNNNILPGIYAGIGTVLGHCFPVHLKFRGGKGVACALALIIMLDWRVALIAFGLNFILFLITRYVSLSSLLIMLVTPVLMLLFGHKLEAVALMVGVAALIWYMHRENIKKLMSGTERKYF